MPKLTVNWQMPSPPVEPLNSYTWQPLSPKPSQIEPDLGFQPGTLAILEKAFEKGLGRFTQWDLSQVSHSQAFAAAASLYKRGVKTTLSQPTERSGCYAIEVVTERPALPNHLLIVDQNLATAWQIHPGPTTLVIALDELTKTLASCAEITRFLETAPSLPVAIFGGGILGDTASLACSLKQRPFAFIPTTLLAMVDACLGGKTGVNFSPFGKNQIGHFAFPENVIIWPGWLATLPVRHFHSGLAEVAKHGLLNRSLYQELTKAPPSEASLADQILSIIEVKAQIVSQDPTEKGIRASLNLGHTLAHALEAVSHQRSPKDYILHGEAVGIGLLAAVVLSKEVNHQAKLDSGELLAYLTSLSCLMPQQRLRQHLGVDDLADSGTVDLLYQHIMQDKKRQGSESRWILLEAVGKVSQQGSSYTVPVSKEAFQKSYLDMLSLLPKA